MRERDLTRHTESERGETRIEQLDRNWTELLQELRVSQTGVQLLSGFLLTLPLQQRFANLGGGQKVLYMVVVGISAASTVCLMAPVMLHRLLFRAGARAPEVSLAHRLATTGTGLFAFAIVGVTAFLFDVVLGGLASVLSAAVTAVLIAALWLWLPLWVRGQMKPAQRTGPYPGRPPSAR